MAFDTIHALNHYLQRQFDPRPPSVLVLSLAGVDQMDSSGIGLLVATRNLINRNMGRFCICGVQNRVLDTFQRMNLLTYFSVFGSEDEALAACMHQEVTASIPLSER